MSVDVEYEKKYKEYENKLKELVKSGKTIQEASVIMNMSASYLYLIKSKSIQDNNWLTDEEVKQGEENRKKEKVKQEKNKDKEIMLNVKKYTELGYKINELTEFIEYSCVSIMRKKENYIKENGWYTDEELKNFQNIKKNKQKEERKAFVNLTFEEKYKIRKEIITFKEYMKSGYKYEEISESMECDISYLLYLRNIAIYQNIWFDKNEIIEYKKLIKERQSMLKGKNIKKETLNAKIQEIENNVKDKKKKIKKYEVLCKICRKSAEIEDKLELNGMKNVFTSGRNNLMDILIILENLEVKISSKDIEIILNSFFIHPELANKKIIKSLISDANRKGKAKSVEMMLNELGNILRDTKFYEPLIEYKRWIKKLKFLPEIKVMKKQGMHNEQIAKKLGMSSAEVSILLNKDENEILGGIEIND